MDILWSTVYNASQSLLRCVSTTVRLCVVFHSWAEKHNFKRICNFVPGKWLFCSSFYFRGQGCAKQCGAAKQRVWRKMYIALVMRFLRLTCNQPKPSRFSRQHRQTYQNTYWQPWCMSIINPIYINNKYICVSNLTIP